MKPQQFLGFTLLTALGLLSANLPAQVIVAEQWVNHQPGPDHHQDEMRGLGTDSLGNVYVAGESWFPATHSDYIVIKYAPDGRQLWMTRFTSAGNSDDSPRDLAVEAAGNVYVTGTSNGTDFATVKFNTSGQQQWAAFYQSPTNDWGYVHAIDVDDQGNVYITGYALNAADIEDYVTIKYNSQGIQQWIAIYDGPIHEEDIAEDLKVDADGNVYVTGYSVTNSVAPFNMDYITIKYNPQGVQQWLARYDSPQQANDHPYKLVLDTQANVYVTGISPGINAQYDYLTVKYNAQGIEQWVARYDCPETYSDEQVSDLAVDAEGSAIITGTVELTPVYPYTRLFLTVKYDSMGNLSWVQRYSYPNSDYASAHALAVDVNRNIYVTGEVENPWGYTDCITMRYNPLGDVEWVAPYNLASSDKEGGYYIDLDGEDNVLVAGFFEYQAQAEQDLLTLKYNQLEGTVVVGMIPTVSPIQIPASGGSFSYHLMAINNVTDSLEVNFWWHIKFPYPSTRTQLIGLVSEVLPLDSSTVFRTQNVPANAPSGTYLYILNAGDYPNIIWAGDTLVVTKLPTGDGLEITDWSNVENEPALNEIGGGSSEGVLTETPALPPQLFNVSISPNPFNSSTVLRFELRVPSLVELEVFDVSGRSVGAKHFPNASPVSGSSPEGGFGLTTPTMYGAGSYRIPFEGSNLPSGIYFVRLEVGGATQVQKILLVK